ncbi:hypothetical protein HNR23_003447 [Nocardiopsis mwathae]|uniref:Esterase n=1 Tax=Nocardiopsis mwathae TaxID=1472723 RepID=A0A7X0D6C8_9ACTN|nr:hypothetical protein [Nocardiopsis mwathae]MBB6173387.1 hypothetical protein [Nocardiopsis mwathae]
MAWVAAGMWSPLVAGDTGFGLTSGKFLLALALLAVAAVVLTVWLWPRLAGRGVLPVLGRIGLVLLVDVTVLAALAAVANREVKAYPTWSDLFTTGSQQRIVGEDTSPATTRAVELQVTGRTAPGVPGGADPAAVGQLQQVSFTGPASGLRGTGTVYLPPEYFAKNADERTFPVVAVVAGQGQDPQRLMTDLSPAAAQLAEARAGRVDPAIWAVLAPSDDTARACVDVPKGPRGLAFAGQDTAWLLRDTYRTSPDRRAWSVAGIGDGAACALRAAMTGSDVYGAAVMLGGSPGTPDNGDLYGDSAEVRSLSDPLWRLRHLPAPPIRVLVGETGGKDRTADELDDAAGEPMTVTALRATGGTTAASWKSRMGDVARWVAPKGEGAASRREGP